jgi:hypothetical protein
MASVGRLVIFLLLVSFIPSNANAAEASIGAKATFKRAISLSNAQNMDFSIIKFSQNITGDVYLGTDGNLSYGAGFSGDNNGKAGSVDISGTIGESVSISCDKTGRLSDENISLELKSIEFSMGKFGKAFGSGEKCKGIESSSLSHLISPNNENNTVKFGAQLSATTDNMSKISEFNTNKGRPITVMIIYN